jgi:SAM-dependent methyltransferase
MSANRYVGTELELFENAANWKRYWSSRILPYVRGRVLEIGSGIGANTRLIAPRARFSRWVCVEPDVELASKSHAALADEGGEIRVICGKIDCIAEPAAFDSILYIDVLEHIPDDAGEVAKAWNRLAPGGHLVVVSPAHNFLFSPFDRQVGHVRRYDQKSLRAVGPRGVDPSSLFYLDAAGMVASLANKLLLKQVMPNLGQILFWDRVIVSVSRVLDPLLLHRLGKSVVCVWRKPV